VLVIDKPSGMTSHDVVAQLRIATGERRIGHAGTLDPLATGVLVVLVGVATRLEQYLALHDKTYEVSITFGTGTDTLDSDGIVEETLPVPEGVFDPTEATHVLRSFLGPAEQLPPSYSAIKTGGVAAHRLARAGKAPDLPPRPIIVHEAHLLSADPDTASWVVRFSVSKGTYIRSLARDIGVAAGTAAHVSALRRTAAGPIGIADAHTLDAAVQAARLGQLEQLFLDPAPLLGLPIVELGLTDVAHGRSVTPPANLPTGTERVACATNDRLLAVYRRVGDRLLAETVFGTGVSR
jgi:tRNA pseudouridine55 synthase